MRPSGWPENSRQSIPIANAEVSELVQGLVNQPGVSPDKRFVYHKVSYGGRISTAYKHQVLIPLNLRELKAKLSEVTI